MSSTARAYPLSSFVRTADPRLNAAAGRADSRLNAAAGRAVGQTGPWCFSRGLVWAALSTRDPLQHRYLHTLRQGSTATSVFTHVTTGIDCNSTIYTRYDRNPLQQRYLGLHMSRQGSTAKNCIYTRYKTSNGGNIRRHNTQDR